MAAITQDAARLDSLVLPKRRLHRDKHSFAQFSDSAGRTDRLNSLFVGLFVVAGGLLRFRATESEARERQVDGGSNESADGRGERDGPDGTI